MEFKNIIAVLLAALILAACAPTGTVPPPTETAAPPSTFTPPPATLTPTPAPATGALSTKGPWLVYVHNKPRMRVMDLPAVPAEFVLLNQDGSGRTTITLPECDGNVNAYLLDGQNAASYMLEYHGGEGGLYLFRPAEATGMLVYRSWWFPVCNTFYNGDEKGGWLLSTYQAAKDASPELMMYELPGGKIRERIPLVKCATGAKGCEEARSSWGDMGQQTPAWSPNGRYLAFVAVMDAASSDLFVYDSKDGSLQRLTSGPDWVGPIDWSPDGTQIIMQEIPRNEDHFLAPSSVNPRSVWSVSVSSNEIKLLYTVDRGHARQNIRLWLDDKRFIAYEGYLVNADQARDLRLVDMGKGTNRVLFDGEFTSLRYDPIHQTFALYELDTEKHPQGIYLVSIKDASIRYLQGPPYLDLPDWDEKNGLFVSTQDCGNDPNSLQAFDYLAKFKCVPKPEPTPTPLPASVETPRYPAPDGKWVVSLKDGTWLEARGKAAVQISQETASDLIWCPDSSCFFFFVPQQERRWALYRVSIPDLAISMVDEGIESTGQAQWLGTGK